MRSVIFSGGYFGLYFGSVRFAIIHAGGFDAVIAVVVAPTDTGDAGAAVFSSPAADLPLDNLSAIGSYSLAATSFALRCIICTRQFESASL